MWLSAWTLRDSGLPGGRSPEESGLPGASLPTTAPAAVKGDVRRQLAAACMSGDVQLVTAILASPGVNPSVADGNGLTPLHMVAFNSKSAFVKPPSAKASERAAEEAAAAAAAEAAIAADADRLECAKALIAAGADCNRPSVALGTPLHMAARCGRPDLVMLLLTSVRDPADAANAKDPAGCTPLHHALRAKSREGVGAAILLLKAGAKPANFPGGEEDPAGTPLPDWTRDKTSWDVDKVWEQLKAELAPAKKKGKGGGKKKK